MASSNDCLLRQPHTVEHAGHSVLPGYRHASPMHVTEQVQHKVDFLTVLHQENPHRRFVLAGHSVGAWICVEVSDKMDQT